MCKAQTAIKLNQLRANLCCTRAAAVTWLVRSGIQGLGGYIDVIRHRRNAQYSSCLEITKEYNIIWALHSGAPTHCQNIWMVSERGLRKAPSRSGRRRKCGAAASASALLSICHSLVAGCLRAALRTTPHCVPRRPWSARRICWQSSWQRALLAERHHRMQRQLFCLTSPCSNKSTMNKGLRPSIVPQG